MTVDFLAETKQEESNMTFRMVHENYNVRDLEASLAFYE